MTSQPAQSGSVSVRDGDPTNAKLSSEDRRAAPLADVVRLHRAVPDGDGAVPVFAGRVRHPGHVDRDERDRDLAVDVLDPCVVCVEAPGVRRKLRDLRVGACRQTGRRGRRAAVQGGVTGKTMERVYSRSTPPPPPDGAVASGDG